MRFGPRQIECGSAGRKVSVFCPAPINSPSLDFAKALRQVVWHKPDSTSVAEYLNKPRGNLFDVAGPIFREQDH